MRSWRFKQEWQADSANFVQGLVKLRCQRCLGELGHVLDLRTDLLLVDRLKRSSLLLMKMNRWNGFLDEPDLDILALIEDEIILSLPISPRHDESECSIGHRLTLIQRSKNHFLPRSRR